MSEMLTRANESKKSKLAPDPTTSMGRVTAIATRMKPVTSTAT